MLKIIFKEQSSNSSIQFLRYILVGIISTVLDFYLLYLLTEYLKIYYLISAIIAFGLCVVVNNLLSINWVFKGQVANKTWVMFGIFSLIAVVGLVMNTILMWVFTDFFSYYYLVSKVISTIIVFLWNFLARKMFVFRWEKG